MIAAFITTLSPCFSILNFTFSIRFAPSSFPCPFQPPQPLHFHKTTNRHNHQHPTKVSIILPVLFPIFLSKSSSQIILHPHRLLSFSSIIYQVYAVALLVHPKNSYYKCYHNPGKSVNAFLRKISNKKHPYIFIIYFLYFCPITMGNIRILVICGN